MKQATINLLFSCALICCCASPAQGQWKQVQGPFGGAVFFLQSYAGAYWAGAESGLYRSSDGQQWDRVASLGTERVVAGLADQDSFYILRGNTATQLLTTTDGGQSWLVTDVAQKQPGIYATLKKASGALILAHVTNDFLYLRSKDNGATVTSLPGGGGSNIDLFDANNGLIVKNGGGVNLRVSQNAGNTYFTRTLPPNNNDNYQIIVLDSAIVVRPQLNGGPISVQISFDTAQTWQNLSLPSGFDPDNVTIQRSGKKGLLVLKDGQDAWTADYGNTWTVFSAPLAPRQFMRENNTLLISSLNGFYRSTDAGATWNDASTGFAGHLVYRVNTAGNRLYALTVNTYSSEIDIYHTEPGGNNNWVKTALPAGSGSLYMDATGTDTLATYDQVSLDGGASWSYINYPNVSNFSTNTVTIHQNKAYVPLGYNIYAVPLQDTPTAQVIYGPTIDDCADILFVEDTLYAITTKGHIFRQLPNTTDWITLTAGGPGYTGRLFRVNGRFFQPRWTDMRYSDDGINFQILPVTGLNDIFGQLTTVHKMIGVDSTIIAATDIGLLFSVDKGEHWWPFQTGLPETGLFALDLAQNNGTVYAALLRHGIWQRDVATGSSSGIVYRDDNQNGIQEPSELPVAGVKVLSVLSDNLTLTDSTGRYNLPFDLSADTVRVVAPVAYSSVQPPLYIVDGVRQNRDFGIWFQPDITDLRISATHTAAMRPGFENSLHLAVTNTGTLAATATIGLKLPPDIQYLSATPAPSAVLGDSLVWLVDSIPFLGKADISVQVQLASTIPLGTILDFNTSVTPENSDFTPLDNVFVLETLVVGAYDPNDKQVWPGDHITPVQVAAGVPLRYTIRFQNTGTYPAERVRLVDTLDADLDLASLTVLGASHPYRWQIIDGHVLEIIFDAIDLPDSNSNEAASHGFFSFSIAAKKTLPLGTPLLNQAAIYFDFNAPIFTNTAFTQVSFESAVIDLSDQMPGLHVLPNPVFTKCTVQMPAAGGNLALFNANGTQLQTWPRCPGQMVIDMSTLAGGVYYFQWQKEKIVASVVVVVAH